MGIKRTIEETRLTSNKGEKSLFLAFIEKVIVL